MRKVNQGKRRLNEESDFTYYVNHADTLNEMTDLIEDENEETPKKIKKYGNLTLPSHESIEDSNDNF